VVLRHRGILRAATLMRCASAWPFHAFLTG
jgi:hypothetical protein